MFDIDPELLHTWQAVQGVLCGEYPNTKEGTPDKIKALQGAGINVFIDLTHPDDALTSYASYLQRNDTTPLSYHSFPIPDGGVVSISTYIELCYLIKLHVSAGSNVYLHCWGGMGRTATVTACLMGVFDRKITFDEAFSRIRDAREDTVKASRPAPENDQQIKLIQEFYHYIDKNLSQGE